MSAGLRGGDPADSRDEVLAEVVSLYYLEGLDQGQIAKRLQVSRSTVSRMIAEARQLGIVEIRINRPLPTDDELRRAAIERYGLREALVLVSEAAGRDLLSRVGALAADYLERTISDDSSVAISWGTSLAATVEALRGGVRHGVKVVQMIGAAGSLDPEVDGSELARKMAHRLGGSFVTLNAPLLVDDPGLARALLRQRSIAVVLEQAADAEVALIGLGGMDSAISSLLRSGFASTAVLKRATRAGIVGDAAGHMLSADGETVRTELSERMIGLDEGRTRAIPTVVAVAAGTAKVAIIRAALLSGLVDVLVTDSVTMRAVMALPGDRPSTGPTPTPASDPGSDPVPGGSAPDRSSNPDRPHKEQQ